MLRKIFIFLICFYCISITAFARDRYIYFVEDLQYKDLYKFNTINSIINKSVKGLGIQRCGGCEFAFYYSVFKRRPSNISIKEIPLYNGNESIDNISIKGFVEKDGTLYVPSKFLVYGQTLRNNKTQNITIFIEHVRDIQELDQKLSMINITKDVEIIISSWSRKYKENYENYIMPLIYYNKGTQGIFYSETTRNLGILDYENINSIMSGKLTNLKIVDGDINKIYTDRVNGLKNKKAFLTNFGYFMGILTIINSMLLTFKNKQLTIFLSLFVIISPLAILIEPILNLDILLYRITAIVIITLILTICLRHVQLKKVSVAFLALIFIDALFYKFLLKNSLLSYEPALGARFYGIGNEFLGIIIAYILILITESKSKNNWVIWLINAGFLLYDGGGSNFGGFLTCGLIGFYISPLLIKLFEIIIAALIICFSNNHIGFFFKNLISLNTEYIKDTLYGKMYTFKRLIQLNIWTELIITSLLIYLYNLLKGILKFDGNTLVFVISCILVVIFNDSGIVSCALIMMVYLNYIFYLILLEEQNGVY